MLIEHKRFYRLRGQSLFYYRNPSDVQPRGVYHMQDYNVVSLRNRGFQLVGLQSSRVDGVESAVEELLAETVSEKSEWVQALSAVAANRDQNTKSANPAGSNSFSLSSSSVLLNASTTAATNSSVSPTNTISNTNTNSSSASLVAVPDPGAIALRRRLQSIGHGVTRAVSFLEKQFATDNCWPAQLFLHPGNPATVARLRDEFDSFCLDLPRAAAEPHAIASFVREIFLENVCGANALLFPVGRLRELLEAYVHVDPLRAVQCVVCLLREQLGDAIGTVQTLLAFLQQVAVRPETGVSAAELATRFSAAFIALPFPPACADLVQQLGADQQVCTQLVATCIRRAAMLLIPPAAGGRALALATRLSVNLSESREARRTPIAASDSAASSSSQRSTATSSTAMPTHVSVFARQIGTDGVLVLLEDEVELLSEKLTACAQRDLDGWARLTKDIVALQTAYQGIVRESGAQQVRLMREMFDCEQLIDAVPTDALERLLLLETPSPASSQSPASLSPHSSKSPNKSPRKERKERKEKDKEKKRKKKKKATS